MIEIILDKSFIEDFGFPISGNSIILNKMFVNENNIFVFNQELIKYIEENILDEYKEYWKNLFVKLSDDSKINSSQNNTLDTDIIYDENSNIADYVLVVKCDNILNRSKNYECNLRDNNKNMVFFKELIQNNKLILRNSDFNNDTEINDFFKKLFSCSKTLKRPIIISRYDKFSCDLISIIKSLFNKKEYWTTKKSTYCRTNDLSYLKAQLGNQLVVYKGTSTQIHERKIIVESLIVEFDNDFDCIKYNDSTWVCNCIIDKMLNAKLFQKRRSLERLL